MSSTQLTVQPATPIGPGLALSIVKDNFTNGQLTALITPPTGGAVLSVQCQPATLGANTFRLTNTVNSDGTVSLINGSIGLTRTETMAQNVLMHIISRG